MNKLVLKSAFWALCIFLDYDEVSVLVCSFGILVKILHNVRSLGLFKINKTILLY